MAVIALIGPHMNSTEDLRGNYNGDPPYIVSPLMAFKDKNIVHARGCMDVACKNDTEVKNYYLFKSILVCLSCLGGKIC